MGFGLVGFNGEDSTIFNNPYFTDTQVATIGQIAGFTNWDNSVAIFSIDNQQMAFHATDASGNPVLQMHDGTLVTLVGQQSMPTFFEKLFGTGTAGWDTRDQSATVAIDSGWTYAGDTETGGLVFRNSDGSYGYTIANNSSYNTVLTTGEHTVTGALPTGFGLTGVASWHLHVDASQPLVDLYSAWDVASISKTGPAYLGTPNGMIQIYPPGLYVPGHPNDRLGTVIRPPGG